ncbi:MAG TPA: hypothetical protein VII59_01820 [Streptosporangiaceae bacterium]|jgi:hypothetical protein
MTAKTRLSVTVDRDVSHDRRLRGIDDFIEAYEAEHGEITDEEMEAAYRRAKARAIVVRSDRVVNGKGS